MPDDSVRQKPKDGRTAYGVVASEFFTFGVCRIASKAGPDFIVRETSNVVRSLPGHAPINRRGRLRARSSAGHRLLVDTPFTAPGMGGFGSSGTRSSRRRFFKVGIAMSPRSFRDRRTGFAREGRGAIACYGLETGAEAPCSR